MKNTPQDRVFKSLLCNRISEFADKVGEVVIDSFLVDSFVKDIPLVGTTLSLLNAGNDVQAYLFTKRVAQFLLEIESTRIEEREKFINDCQTSKSKKQKLGESILIVLDSARSSDSATQLGRAFALMMQGKIPEPTFYMYSHIISNLTPHLTQQLKYAYQHDGISGFSGDSMHYLNSLGLVDMKLKLQQVNGTAELHAWPETNKFGKDFYLNILQSE